MKILFLIRSLEYGGAESQLVVLARGLHKLGIDVSVAVFYSGGPFAEDLRAAGVRIIPLGKRHRWDNFRFFWRLRNLVVKEQPDIIHSYLVVQNLITALLKLSGCKSKVVWGVAASYMDFSQYDWTASVSFRASMLMSRWADLIISNSHAGRTYHIRNGYPAERMTVIPNGIDTGRFAPNKEIGMQVRKGLGLDSAECIIGTVGRLDPMKDYPNLIRAAAEVVKTHPDAKFVCFGNGPRAHQQYLLQLCEQHGVPRTFIWAGARRDIENVYNAFDIMVLASLGEGLPNVLIEAMACGIPCVATDVGDSRLLLADMGQIVPPKDPNALAAAICAMMKSKPAAASIRQRIIDEFSVEVLVRRTLSTLENLCQATGRH